MNTQHYIYEATVIRVIDGDTVDLRVRLGFGVEINVRVRMAGYNAPEIRSLDPKVKSAGLDAMMKFDSLLHGEELIIHTVKLKNETDAKEKYGRYLATIYLKQYQLSVNQTMIDYLTEYALVK